MKVRMINVLVNNATFSVETSFKEIMSGYFPNCVYALNDNLIDFEEKLTWFVPDFIMCFGFLQHTLLDGLFSLLDLQKVHKEVLLIYQTKAEFDSYIVALKDQKYRGRKVRLILYGSNKN